jgi:uncharacterized iron-regulated membrane protein
MRRVLALLHRWFGLFNALFLFVAGSTGAIIAWDHELDGWLNPELYRARSAFARPLGASEILPLVERLEREEPRLAVRYVPLALEPGSALQLMVAPRSRPGSAEPYPLSFNQVALDPSDGRVQARRMWGEPSLARQNLLPFLYKLHYTLHIPQRAGAELGVLIMGMVALVWTVDCFIALWLSFPQPKAWRKSFAFRLRAGAAKLTFDLHRSGGVWVWPLLLTLAVTGVAMNLGKEVVRPIVSLFSPLKPAALEQRTILTEARAPVLSFGDALMHARSQAERLGIAAPPGALFYAPERGAYGVGFFAPGHDHGDGGLGNPWLYLDARDGHALGAEIPGRGSAGDVFMQAQFPLHSGRIAGLTGRVIVSLLGAVVAMLSVTGVLLWARRRRARVRSAQRLAEPVREGRDLAGC